VCAFKCARNVEFKEETVIRKIIVLLLIATAWECVQSPSALAQNSDPCVAITTWWFPDPIPFGWYFYGAYPGTFAYLIAAKTCPAPPECPCKQNTPDPEGSKPIVFASGDTYVEDTDISLPGLGGGLRLNRRWNSVWPQNELLSSSGIFGSQWKSTYEERVFLGDDGYVKYARADGSYVSLYYHNNTITNLDITLHIDPIYFDVTLQNGGEVRNFDKLTGMLTGIVDRNGNSTQLEYDSSGRLSVVADPAGRHLYFNYPNGSSTLVSSVTSDFGVTVTYTYDSINRLIQVTKPDLSTINYTYNSQSQITQVTDSNGKVLETHTYDSNGRGLTASQANGVNSVTVSYPQ